MKLVMRNPVLNKAVLGLTGRRLLATYVGAVVAAGVTAIALAAAFGTTSGDLVLIVALIVAGALSERFKVGLFGDSHVSLAAATCMAAGIIGGPRDVVLVAPCVAIAANFGGALPLYKTAFNVAVYVLASLVFVGTFHLTAFVSVGADWPQMLIPATIAALAYFAVNVVFVAGAVSLSSSQPVAAVIKEKYLWLAPHYLPLGAVAAAMASGYGFAGAWIIPLFAIPLASIQMAMFQYSAARVRDLEQLRDAQARIEAVEAELERAVRMERQAPGPYAA